MGDDGRPVRSLAYGYLVRWALNLGFDRKSMFARLVAAGLAMTLFLYVSINIAMVMGLAPVVGIPLPLLSYGGSAMMTVLILLGSSCRSIVNDSRHAISVVYDPAKCQQLKPIRPTKASQRLCGDARDSMHTDDADTVHYRLRRQSRTPAWLALSWRALVALALIGIALAVHWFDSDGLRQNSGAPVTFADILYFTMITVTTVGYGDIVPVTQQARMFDTFVVTPIRLFVWLIFLGTAYDFLLKGVWEKWRMSVIQRHLEGHVVVAGFGTSGSEAVSELIRRGADPGTIVVVDERAAALRTAESAGTTVMEGTPRATQRWRPPVSPRPGHSSSPPAATIPRS